MTDVCSVMKVSEQERQEQVNVKVRLISEYLELSVSVYHVILTATSQLISLP